MTTADQMVSEWLVRRYQAEHSQENRRLDAVAASGRSPAEGMPSDARRHLAACEEAIATGVEAEDGEYGCDTGCPYVQLKARISCGHGFVDVYDYGNFGDLAGLVEDLERGSEPCNPARGETGSWYQPTATTEP